MRYRNPAGSWAQKFLLLGAAVSVLLALPFWGSAQTPTSGPAATRPDRSPADLQREYQQRFNRLRADDTEGHYTLAEWCRENRMYRLLLRQSQHVLQLDPGHENARLLYRLAVEQLRAQTAQTQPEQAEAAASGDGELLTLSQIQKVKYAEFLDRDQVRPPLPAANGRARVAPEPVGEFLQVRFKENVLNQFLDQMAGTTDFGSRDDRTRFLAMAPTLQAQIIREQTGDEYQKQIEIVNDPLVVGQFERVLPTVMSGCGTSLCHGGSEAEKWRLRTTRPRTSLNLYTNFVIVNRVRNGNQRLVDRRNPEDSLLLQYGLPAQQATYQHPTPIPVMFPRGRDDLRYRTILTWIENLRVPEPRLAITLPGYPEPPLPQIGGVGKPANNNEAPVPK